MHRILYVDDDEVLVQLVRRTMRRSGFEVSHVPEASQVLVRLRSEPFDVIVLDHHLRNGTGHDVLRCLREEAVTLPVVYVTASSDVSVAVQALKLGADDYVIKTPDEEFMALLHRAIAQAIETARLRADKARADAETVRAKERAEALLAEVNHRVANSLALVISLLRLQASASDDENVKRILNESCGRVTAIVNVHRSLYIGEEFHAVRMDQYLDALVENLRLTIPDEIRLVLEAEPLLLRPDQAVSVGVIVTELTANATKYAYPDGRGGSVRVSFRREADGRASVSVSDDGVGLQEAASPVGTGLGRRIVTSMATGLGAALEFSPRNPGTEARIRFRIDDPPHEERSASVA